MTGETKAQVSGWTVDTLRDHFLLLLSEADRRNEQRFQSTQEAIAKAERATELRFESVNEFRQTLTDQASSFMTRAAFDESQKAANAYRDTLNSRFEVINTRLTTRDGEKTGSKETRDDSKSMIALVIAVGTALITVASFFLKR